MGTNKIHIGTTFRDDIIAPTFQSRGEKYARLQESLNRTTQPRTDSSDSFANTQMSRDMHNDGEEAELVVRNAGFVEC
jgi:hypothetical protein